MKTEKTLTDFLPPAVVRTVTDRRATTERTLILVDLSASADLNDLRDRLFRAWGYFGYTKNESEVAVVRSLIEIVDRAQTYPHHRHDDDHDNDPPAATGYFYVSLPREDWRAVSDALARSLGLLGQMGLPGDETRRVIQSMLRSIDEQVMSPYLQPPTSERE